MVGIMDMVLDTLEVFIQNNHNYHNIGVEYIYLLSIQIISSFSILFGRANVI